MFASRLASRLVTGASVSLMGLLLAGLVAWLVAVPMILEQHARSMAPPVYPGATVVKHTLNSAAGATTETTVYFADTELHEVRGWMEDRRYRFSLCAVSTAPDCHVSERCDEALWIATLSQLLSLGEDQRARPCVSIILEPDSSGRSRTFIHVNIGWPSVD